MTDAISSEAKIVTYGQPKDNTPAAKMAFAVELVQGMRKAHIAWLERQKEKEAEAESPDPNPRSSVARRVLTEGYRNT